MNHMVNNMLYANIGGTGIAPISSVAVDTLFKGFDAVTPMGVIEKYLNTLNSVNTRNVYRSSIEHFFAYLLNGKTMTFDDFIIDPKDTIEYSEYLKEQLEDGEIKTATYNKRIQGVRKFYDWLKINTTSNRYNIKLLAVNPFHAVKQLSETDTVGSDPLIDQEIISMFENPWGSNIHIQERNKLMLELGLITGIRRTALITSKIEDIKYGEGVHYMEVLDKNKKIVRMKIDSIYDRLIKWYNEDIKNRINNNNTIFNISVRESNRIIRQWADSLNINKKITFHSLRTTTAVQIYLRNNGSLDQARSALNHDNTAITKRYVDKAHLVNTEGDSIVSDIYNEDPLYRKLMMMDKASIIDMILKLDEENRRKVLCQLD